MKIKEAEEAKRDVLKDTIRTHTLSTIKNDGEMKRNDLEDMIDAILSTLEFKVSETERRAKISETISEMIAKNEIKSDGYNVRH